MNEKAIGRVIDDVVAVDPDRTALIIAGEPTSFGQLATAAAQAAAGLQAAGVSRGWRVPLVDDASVLAVATLIGATQIGAATALMNPRLTGAELATLLQAAGAGSTGGVGCAYAAVGTEAGIDPVLGTTTLLAGGGLDPGERAEPAPTDDAVVLFTSGTTGTPK